MKTLASILTALALLLTLATSALAGGDQGGDAVTKTYELTLYGEVDEPDDRALFVHHYTVEGGARGLTPLFVQLCGPNFEEGIVTAEEDPFRYKRGDNYEPRCSGGGAKYTTSVEMNRGENLFFQFVTLLTSDPDNSAAPFYGTDDGDNERPKIGEDTELITSDVTNRAYYEFNTEKGGEGSGPGAPSMPETGAGGLTGAGLPLGPDAAALSLLAACGYAARKRR